MKISEEFKDILTEVVNIGIGRASSSLSELLGCPISLTVPEVHVFTYPQMQAYLHEKPGEYVNVLQAMHGGLTGKGVLSFPLINGKTLVDQLLANPSSGDNEFGAVEMEAIQEVGNIVVNAVGSVVSDMTGLQIYYEVPLVAFMDHMVPMLEESLGGTGQPIILENIYCFSSTMFSVKGIDVVGYINLIFTYDNVAILEAKLSQKL